MANTPVIRTPRLDLHTVRPADYDLLAEDRGHPELWVDRGFSNPYGHLVATPGPLPHRLPLVRADPSAAPYLLRMAVLRQEACIIGSAGFHGLPDERGMIEIGLEVVPEMRRNGYAREVLRGMWSWAAVQPGVRILRYSVGVDNEPSQRLIASFGFAHSGVQIDEEDGPEDVYEQPVDAYLRRQRLSFGALSGEEDTG